MATGFSSAAATSILDGICNATPFSYSNVWIKLHIGDPGAAGTSNPATVTDRKEATFGAASAGAISNDNTLSWPGVGGSEDFTHYSAWTASSGGTFEFSGLVTANPVDPGDDFEIAPGEIDLSIPIAS